MKKIMFSDKFDLTQAVLEGRKTMTRRIVGKRMTEYDVIAYLKGYTELANNCAQYKIGEIVAVAQSYKDAGINGLIDVSFDGVPYFAKDLPGWTNKMFVSANLMPHQIRITDIDVERLQDISDDDCINEGIFYDYGEDVDGSEISYFDFVGNNGNGFGTPREAFASFIDNVSGKGTWNSNPWVFAYCFELIK